MLSPSSLAKHPPMFWRRFCVAVYFAVGFVVLSSQEDWEPSTVLYVVAQIVTTIGQGPGRNVLGRDPLLNPSWQATAM